MDLRVLDLYVPVVVGKRICGRVALVGHRKLHPVQCQVTVVLDQHLRVRRCDRTILKGDLIVLQQLECLCFCTGTSDKCSINCICEPAEIYCQAGSILALGDLDSVSRAVLQQGDRVPVNGCCEGLLKCLVLHASDLCDVVLRDYFVRIHILIFFIWIIYIFIIRIKEYYPIAIVDLAFVLIS